MGNERRAFGRYSVIARLGRGGMGQVFLAMHSGPGGVQKLVVVKQLRDDLASSPIAREMFLDEARVAAVLQHPNVVQTYEVVDDGDDLYIVMEYLDGRSLARTIEGDQPATLTLPMRLRVLADVLAALHYAHERTDYDGTPLGVVHRDVSPQNIFLTYDGHVKLLDFGIAKAANATAHTDTGMFKGKVRHAAPEQALGMAVDRRADVYAVGTVLWESLTGQRMWKDQGEATILFALASGKIPSLREMQRSVPEELEAICQRALARDPDERYATANDFRHAILEYLHAIGDTTSERDIAKAMDAAFHDRRREMQVRIEAQIRATRAAHGSSAPPPSLPRLSHDSVIVPTPVTATGRTSVPLLQTPRTAMSDAPIAPPSVMPGDAGHAGPKPRRWPWVAAIGVAVAAVGAVVTLRAPNAAVASAASARPAPAAVEATARPPRRIHVSLRADPTTAQFLLDDTPLGNPYEADVDADERPHAVTIRADGFDPRAVAVSFASDVNVVVALTPLAGRSAPTLAAAPRAAPAYAPYAPLEREVVPQKPKRAIDEDDPYSDNPYVPK